MLPEPQSKNYSALINSIEEGRIKIPQFQREFVWSKDKSAHLLDSIIKGYPIGTFIIWKTKEKLRSVKEVGNIDLPDTPQGDYVHYILDGQQRLTSLFASIKAVKIGKSDFSDIYIDLTATEYDPIIITDISEHVHGEYIRFKDMLKFDRSVTKNLSDAYYDKLQHYRDVINNYQFSTIEITDASIDVATEIFTRINVGGKPLSVFEIMCAKMFDVPSNFDLYEKFKSYTEDKLKNVGYDTINEANILQLMAIILTPNKECKAKHILNLNKPEFLSAWPKAIDAFDKAIDYFISYFRIPVSELLPYKTLLVPFAYFFYQHPNQPDINTSKFLDDFFWRVSLSERYSSSVEGKLAQDIKRIDKIIAGELPDYDYRIYISPDDILEKGQFKTSSSYSKAFLCLLAYFEPKSFSNNSKVILDNAYLKQSNSKNYHHFFPRSYLRKQQISDEFANHIANITIVSDYLNKREIGAKPPSIYMQKFTHNNPNIIEAMKTHLIEAQSPHIANDNYKDFIYERCTKFSDELKKRIINK